MVTRKNRYNHILQVIDDRLIPDDSAKKNRGEVFTPPDLVREILFGLRKDKLEKDIKEIWGIDKNGDFIDEPESNRIGGLPNSVWQNPTLKWLDPANGIGNFPIIAFYKLDYELSKVDGYKNKDKRQQHIIEKMLYMIELDKGNCITCRQIFKKILPYAKPNILCTDSLQITSATLTSKKFPEIYDIIMGNPPFNPGVIWWRFIEKYTNIAKSYLLFIVPSTFTSNITGEKVVDFLKINGLKLVKYLELKDFNNNISLDTLYFVLEKGYNNTININNLINIPRDSPIINLKNENDTTIFNKILEYIKDNGSLKLFKGKNETLNYKTPVETDNIKFKETTKYSNRMLSRLGGGTHEYYWVDKFIKEDINMPKIVFPRGTGSYNSVNNLLNISKDIVYNTCVDKNEILSNGIMYTPLENIDKCKYMKWYTMRSKLVRYIFIKVNHLAELTKTVFSYIPNIDIDKLNNDYDVYEELGFNSKEINYIEDIFKGKIKIIESKESVELSNTLPKSRYAHKTRKLRRH